MKEKAAAWLNIASALCGFTGLVLSLLVNGVSCLAMYTDQVALAAGIISVIYAVHLLRSRSKAGSPGRPATRLPFLRFASAVPQVVLIIAALISFLPAFTFPFNVLSPHLLLMHFGAPILSLVSYFALEPKAPLRPRDTLYAMVYTLLYAAAAIAVTAGGFYHSEAYPFLDFHPGHIAAPILEDIAILLAIYLIDLLFYKLKVLKK